MTQPTRRDVLELGGLAGMASMLGVPMTPLSGQQTPQDRPAFRTSLCDLLGIDYPILQAPMPFIATPRLVAAVCEAGGLGVLAGIGVPPDELRQRIRETRALTKRPFGVNLILHSAIRPPVDPSTIPDGTVSTVQGILNRFRERLGLAPNQDRPPRVPDVIPAVFDMIVEERVPLYIEEYRSSGAPVFPPVVQQMAARDVVDASAQKSASAFYPLYAGQGVGLIDAVPVAADIVRSMISEARAGLASLPRRVQT